MVYLRYEILQEHIRGGFNLHTGRESDGCVTVWSDVSRGDSEYPKSEDYNKLKNLLNKTKPLHLYIKALAIQGGWR